MTAVLGKNSARGKPGSTTRRDLLRLRAALLVVTGAVFAASLAAFTGVMSTVRDAAARTAPAVLDVVAARTALVLADSAAMASFQTGQVQLVGPGEQYQNQMATASQNLAQLAEHNAAGESGSRTLQVVEGLVVDYGRWIEDADAHFRAGGVTPLGATDLWSASQLMHGTESGILTQLDTMAEAQRTALREQLSTGWLFPASALVWVLPILLLLGLLLLAQVFGKRRFRRTVNPALAGATLLLLLVAGATSMVFVAQARADVAKGTLNRTVGDWTRQISAVAVTGQRDLAKVMRAQCGGAGQDGCGDTVGAFMVRLAADGEGDQRTIKSGVAGTQQVEDEFTASDQSGFLEYFIPVGTAVIAGLILVGFRRGIDEYRYRST
jgi:hypothetical protein